MVSLAHWASALNMSLVICSYSYDFTNFRPPAAIGFDGSANLISTVRILLQIMLQKINQNYLGVVTRASGSTITGPSSFVDWYLPCNIHSPIEGSGANLTGYKSRANLAHLSEDSFTIQSDDETVWPGLLYLG